MRASIQRGGALALVVGPSGAGKDTLFDYSRIRLGLHSGFVFARRAITRPPSAGEDHEPVSEEEFHRRVSEGAFALHWHAHGLSYGIPATIDAQIDQGMVVIANGSRAILSDARRHYPRVLIVNVTAPIEVLAERLAGRGRESENSLRQRLARPAPNFAVGNDVLHIDNSGPPEVAGERLLKALLTCRENHAIGGFLHAG